MVGISLFPSSKIHCGLSKTNQNGAHPNPKRGRRRLNCSGPPTINGQSCAQGFASSSYPTVCLSVLDARTRWQVPGVTFTTDRLGRRCLEPTRPAVKDSFVKKPRVSHAWACHAFEKVNQKSAGSSAPSPPVRPRSHLSRDRYSV